MMQRTHGIVKCFLESSRIGTASMFCLGAGVLFLFGFPNTDAYNAVTFVPRVNYVFKSLANPCSGIRTRWNEQAGK